MIDFSKYPNFAEHEFNRPEGIDEQALQLLQRVRTLSGIPFRITSDFRPQLANANAGGSPFSLHLLGRAFDFVIDPWNAQGLWKVARAVILVGEERGVPNTQFEIVDSSRDRHIHLGWYPNGDTREPKLYVKPD